MKGQTKHNTKTKKRVKKTHKQRFHKILRKSKTKSRRSRSRSRIGGGNGRLINWVPLAKLNWDLLCKNPSPAAIELLKKNQTKLIGGIYHKIQQPFN